MPALLQCATSRNLGSEQAGDRNDVPTFASFCVEILYAEDD